MQTLRPLAGILLATALAPVAVAQDKSQDELIAQRTEKLAKPVFQDADWHFDYDQARAAAKEQGKLILTYFTRSYSP